MNRVLTDKEKYAIECALRVAAENYAESVATIRVAYPNPAMQRVADQLAEQQADALTLADTFANYDRCKLWEE